MDEKFKKHLTAKETWLRGFFILVFIFLLSIAKIVTWAVVVVQFFFTLFSGRTNKNLLSFGYSLSWFIHQCLMFITFNTDVKPFPYTPWPLEPVSEPSVTKMAVGKKTTAKKAAAKKSGTKKSTAEKAESVQTVPGETQSEYAAEKDIQAEVAEDQDSSDLEKPGK